MLRILLAHYSVQEYLLFKTDLHKISRELTVSQVDCEAELFNLLPYFVPDLLFLSLSVEDRPSMRCLQKLRSEQRFHSLPVVIYSHAADCSYAKEYYFSENNHYMVKPYSFESLCKTLELAFASEYSTEQFPFKKEFVANEIHE